MKTAKLATSLLPKLAQAAPGERLPVIVQLRSEGKGVLDLRAFATQLPVRRSCHLLPSLALSASSREIAHLSDDPRVTRIWPDLVVHTCLDVSAHTIQAPSLWTAGWTGEGVRIAVVDTGLDASHPDFAGRVLATRDFTGEGDGDGNGHGTHVAGIAVGAGKLYRGIAPGAQLIVAKALKSTGDGFTSDIMAALDWAVDQRAQVLNLSLGTGGPSDGRDVLSLTVDAVVARGVTVCVAAGNDGPGPSTVGSPGAAHGAVTVGATTREGGIAEFSSRGPTADGRVKPDLSAPGSGIVSARANGTTMGTPVGAQYVRASGTSMATPHVAGAAALLLQAIPGLAPGELKRVLCGGAASAGAAPNDGGAGQIGLAAALELARRPGGGEPQPSGCLSLAILLRLLAAFPRRGGSAAR